MLLTSQDRHKSQSNYHKKITLSTPFRVRNPFRRLIPRPIQAARSVAVLGQTVYQQLFAASGEDPLGTTIRIGKQLYRVVGVLQTKGGASGLWWYSILQN